MKREEELKALEGKEVIACIHIGHLRSITKGTLKMNKIDYIVETADTLANVKFSVHNVCQIRLNEIFLTN